MQAPEVTGTRAAITWQRMLIPLVLVLAVLGLPIVALSFLGMPTAGPAVGLSGLATLIATYVLGWRIGLAAAVALAIGIPVCLLASGNWVAASALMAGVGIAFGMTAMRGWLHGLTLIPIAFGFAVADPPQSALSAAGLAVITTVAALTALLAVGVVHAITRGRHRQVAGQVSASRAIGYAAMLGIAAAITSGIAVQGGWLHAGGWLIMTPFIVLQPNLKDALRKSLKRGIGTIAGFAIAFALAIVVSHGWAAYAIGIGAAALTLYALERHWDYAAYAASLTVAVVFIEGAATSVAKTSELRLVATVTGVLVCLAIMAVANPVFVRAEARLPAS